MQNQSQSIACTVTSCRYNARGRRCSLESIEVKPRKGDSSGQPEESLCASYRIED